MKIRIGVVTYRSSCPSPDLPGEGGACESKLTLSMYGSYLWHPGLEYEGAPGSERIVGTGVVDTRMILEQRWEK